MFGYITVDRNELRDEDYETYRGYYCGLCYHLYNCYGRKAQITLNFDMTFLALFLTSLYEEKINEKEAICLFHPFTLHQQYSNRYIDYACDMSIVFSYLKCEDDWIDEKKKTGKIMQSILKKDYLKVKKQYKEKVSLIEIKLNEIHQLEEKRNASLDQISGLFGEIMGTLFVYREDEWKDLLYEFGFYLGKYIYLMDAYDDLEKDKKKNLYNPFFNQLYENDFEKKAYGLLEMMIANAATAFECLPIIENTEIIKNILYKGVWVKYQMRHQKRMEARI